MTKRVSKDISGRSGYSPSQSYRKETPSMTCLIQSKTPTGTIIAADTWNTNPANNHQIPKIFINRAHPLIIGTAGINSTQYSDGTVKYVSDIVKDVIHLYDGSNLDECLDILFSRTEEMLTDMQIPEGESMSVIQYCITYYDNESKTVSSQAHEIYKHAHSYKGRPCHTYLYTAGFGRYWEDINRKMYNKDVITASEVKDLVQYYIDMEQVYPVEVRTVGGKVVWACMDSNGNIETNIE